MQSVARGLDTRTAEARLQAEGRNEPARRRRRSWLGQIGMALREPMLALLVAASLLYVALGQPADAALLALSTAVVVGITVAQERRTDRALEALRELASPHARVIRDGVERRLDAAELVRGDLVLVEEGERIPADCELVETLHLEVDESSLTGEAMPVAKHAARDDAESDAARIFAGTLVTTGSASAVVRATGTRTVFGALGASLATLDPLPSPLQREVKRLVRWLGLGALGVCVLVVVVFAISRGGTLEAWGAGLLAGIALAMSAMPEELPVVLTVFSALGAWRLARANVLTRKMATLETLGLTDVLCVDKTGTLTRNHMVLERVCGRTGTDHGLAVEASPDVLAVLELAMRASRLDAHDPMDRAIHDAAPPHASIQRSIASSTLHRELPWTPELTMMSNVWALAADEWLVASKGSTEAILSRCEVTPARRAEIEAEVERLGANGWRVLGLGRALLRGSTAPTANAALTLEYAGLLAFSDPIRPEVPAAVARCAGAGVRVLMITGDAPATAAHVARCAGLPPGGITTGAEIAAADDAELAKLVETSTVFARVRPQQKLRIVQALQTNGHVVGMTGDGVNDAPALEAAHVGIAMGERGSDVAREAADLILLDDGFGSLVEGIATGRRIDENLRKAARFIVAVHIPILGLSLLPAFSASWPLLLLPAHIAVLELLIDPACSLVLESEPAPPEAMSRPPRRSDSRLFSRPVVQPAILEGAAILAVCLVVLQVARSRFPEGGVRALVFTALLAAVLALIQAIRTGARPLHLQGANLLFFAMIAAAAGLLGLELGTTTGRALFHVQAVPWPALLAATLAGAASLSWLGREKR